MEGFHQNSGRDVGRYPDIALSAMLILAACLIFSGCGGASQPKEEPSLELQGVIPLGMAGFELSSPVVYPEIEYGGIFIAGGNTNAIYKYHPDEGLTTVVEPQDVPEGVEGVGAFCYADGDFIFRPLVDKATPTNQLPRIFQLTRNGHIRQYNLPSESFEDVRDIGILVYLGDGKLLLETRPRGPFGTIDLVTGEVVREPAQPPPLDTVQNMVADYGAKETYLVRRAKDMSVYLLRYTFKGTYRGPAYVQRREFIASASSVENNHFLQYASGLVDWYDFQYVRQGTIDVNKLVEADYGLYTGFTILGRTVYLIGQKGTVLEPRGCDLLVFNLKGVR